MKNTQVVSLGGNQYDVIIDGVTETVYLDGLTVVSNEDYDLIEAAGLDYDSLIAPKHIDDDKFWEAAVEYASNASEFDVEKFISENR